MTGGASTLRSSREARGAANIREACIGSEAPNQGAVACLEDMWLFQPLAL